MYYVADQGAGVINLSWGFLSGSEPSVFRHFLTEAAAQNIVIVASAGNTGRLMTDTLNWPAAYGRQFAFPPGQQTVISVGAYNMQNNNLATISSYGDQQLDLFAPGFEVTSFYVSNLGTTGKMTGTSVAAPYVSRTAAIIKGLNPSLTAAEIKNCILQWATPATVSTPEAGSFGILVLDHDLAINNCQ
jgi:subtilisin family serine protease